MDGLLGPYFAKKALDGAFKAAGLSLKGIRAALSTSEADLESALEAHLNEVNNWASEVKFADLRSARETRQVFVALECYVTARSRHMNSLETEARVLFDSLFEERTRHFVILGGPGAGKTTSMKNLCCRLFTDDTFLERKINFPVLVRLRDLGSSAEPRSLFESICDILGLGFDLPSEVPAGQGKSKISKERVMLTAIVAILEKSKAMLILDGFDEIVPSDLSRRVLQEIRSLVLSLNEAIVLVTARTGAFPFDFERASVYELCPLNKKQIVEFANKWLQDKDEATRFVNGIYKSPYADTAIRPLMLAHLCAIFERIGEIPVKPKDVYRKILQLLLMTWDEERSVQRLSKYGEFPPSRKSEFLSKLAYYLCLDRQRLTFSVDDIKKFYHRNCEEFGLPLEEEIVVAREIESHTGLLVQSGFDSFEFAHKSLQEFLAAEHIVRLPMIPSWNTIKDIPNEMAIATSISSDSTGYLTALLDLPWGEYEAVDFFWLYSVRLRQEKVDFRGGENSFWTLMKLNSFLTRRSASKDPVVTYVQTLIKSKFELAMRVDFYFRPENGAENGRLRLLKYSNSPYRILPDELFVQDFFWDTLKSLKRIGN